MTRATITIHLPVHRRESLQRQGDTPLARGTYDERIGGYVDFLRNTGRSAGFRVQTDNRDLDFAYTIDENDHEQKKAAHDWLQAAPDIWEWIT